MPTAPGADPPEHGDQPADAELDRQSVTPEVQIPVTTRPAARPFSVVDAAIRLAIVGLALGTAYIHSTLGGLLFTLNAAGYLVAAVAMIAPLAIASRFRWFIRFGLMGYALTTIVGWAITGPYYSTAYVAKAIEVALIVLLAVDFVRFDGNPVSKIRSEIGLAVALLRGRRAEPAGI